MSYAKKVIVSVLISFIFLSGLSFAKSIAFNKTQLMQIKAQKKGEQWLMLLWSVDCPPCFKELGIIHELKKQHDNLNVVIINSDADDGTTLEREAIIEKFELTSLSNFHFVDGEGDRSRYIIDPQWYGELPRSYFIDKNGKFHGKSGLVNKSMLTQWLIK